MAGHSDNVAELPTFDEAPKIALVIAHYYKAIGDAQIASASSVIEAAGGTCEVVNVPGSLEIGPAIAMLHKKGEHDGYVALGCVIRGRTSHYDVVVNESARAITMLGLAGACIGNGIITVEDRAQAEERADTDRLDTAGGAAQAALHLIALRNRLDPPVKGVGFKLATGGTAI
ncbi:MAG: 6,7-dimethyl-8-ribityllumazine synthase [Hasllibacter sp.]